MNYTERQYVLKKSYNSSQGGMVLDNASGISMNHVRHHSLFTIECSSYHEESDKEFFDLPALWERNMNFSYPVVRPNVEGADKKAIILLHGLNERSWEKYLSWAYYLAEITGKSVILFPIAFHMNRSPEDWKDPRSMNPYVARRIKKMPDVKDLSFANVALSERLTVHPQQFFLSGYQSANDLIQLSDELRSGGHPLFKPGATVDFFAYSIGVLLSQVLLLANPGKRFDRSKFFFFCGGSVFESMHGISRYILDDKAFSRVSHFYRDEVGQTEQRSGIFSDLLNQSVLGRAFQAMTSFRNLKKMKGNIFHKLREQIEAVTLKDDRIIPSTQVLPTLKGTHVEEWDFPFPYSHEIPFPLFGSKQSVLVDRAFDKVFTKAGLFLV